jgi:hypothetical protein
VRRFSTLLHDLCVSQLKLDGINKGRDSKGAYFEGLAIRFEDDDRDRPISFSSPPPKVEKLRKVCAETGLPPQSFSREECSSGSPNIFTESDGLKTQSDGLVTDETLDSDGSDGSDGLFLSGTKEVNLFDEALEKQKENNSGETNEICHHFHHNPSLPTISAVTNPSPELIDSSLTHYSPSPEEPITPESLAAQITKCQSWSAALELIDDTSIKTGKKRVTILKTLFNRCFDECDRQYFLELLNAHIAQFPEDERALKAIVIANSNSQQGEKT